MPPLPVDSVTFDLIPAATALTGTEIIPSLQAGSDAYITPNQINTFVGNNIKLQSPAQLPTKNILSISSNATLTYPLPDRINCVITSNVNITFPAFDVTKLQIGQLIEVVNDTSYIVGLFNSVGGVIGVNVNAGEIALLRVSGISPDTLDEVKIISSDFYNNEVTSLQSQITSVQNQVNNFYGGAAQVINTGAATTYQLTYPLAPRYTFIGNPGVNLHVLLPVLNTAQQQPGQSLELANESGNSLTVTLCNSSGSQIASTLTTGQLAEYKLNGASVDSWFFGTAAGQNIAVANGIATLDSNTRLTNSQSPLQTFNPQSGSTYTATTTDINNVIKATFAGTCNITLPSDANNPNVPVGSKFYAQASGASTIAQFTPDSGVTINFSAARTTVVQGQIICAIKSAANTFDMVFPGGTLGLQNLNNVNITGGAITGTTIPLTTESTTARTLVASDCGRVINCTHASGCTITVPTLSAGFWCKIFQKGGATANVTFVGSGVTLTSADSALKTRTNGSSAVIYFDSTTTAELSGDLIL